MQCNSCGFSNPSGMNYCGRCATAILLVCEQCQFENPADFKFCGSCGSDIHLPKRRRRSDKTAPENQALFDTAERRQLTVVFCDVVGSSVLSESVDPEELREIMQKYRAVSDAVVKKYNGHTAQYLGDGILAYFGYPKANEDDAQRAVRAGIELVENIQELNLQLAIDHHIELDIRVGVHTGLVVVGDTRDNNQNSLALGTTPNIAARIQDYAKPNTVIISHSTYELIQQQFDCEKLGEQQFKGFTAPICVYQALKALDINRWMACYDNSNIIPLIGREQEAALLLDRLDQAIGGTGQAVLLNGEAGIGKSRLTQFVREQLVDRPHQIIECWGTPQYQNSYLHCIIKILRQIWVLDQLSEQQKLSCIEESLQTLDTTAEESVPLLAELLGIDLSNSHYSPCHLPPEQKKLHTLELLLALLTNMNTDHVTVIIAEDLHWIDPTTLELLGLIIDQVPTYNIFVLLTFRLDFQPPWQTRSHLTHISINRLTRKQSSKMVSWITQNKKLPVEIFQQIIDKTDGIPFFVEELTQMVLRSNLLIEGDDHYTLRNSVIPLQIPTSLQDSLMARLDSLGDEKELAQISAIVGREFSQEVLQAVIKKQVSQKHDALEGHLSNLVCSELLYQRGLPPKASYMFRHALVHEAAYQSLLIKTRHKYHVQIAEILTENHPDIVEQNPELIAHHYANGGDHLVAINFLIIAVDKALRRSAIVDAIIHLGTGLQCIEQLKAPHEQKLALELAIQARLARAYSMTRGYGDPAVEKCYSRAHSISQEISKSKQSFPLLMGMWEYYVVRAKLTTATELANVMDKIANEDNLPELAIESKRVIGSTLFWQGKFSEAKSYLLQGLGNAEQNGCSLTTHCANQDPRVAGLSNLACLLWLTGYADQSLKTANEAVSLADKLNHPFSQAYAHLFRAVVLHLRGEYAELGVEAEKLLSLSTQYNFLFWQTTALMMQAWSLYQSNPISSYIVQFEQALKQYQATGSRLALSYYQSMLVDLYSSEKQYSKALTLIETALEDANSRGDLFFTAELMRMKANTLHVINGDNSQTVELLDKANTLATQQGAYAIQLRIAISRHELLDNSVKPNTYVHIQNLLSHITEGENCIDVVTAKRISASQNEITQNSNKSLH